MLGRVPLSRQEILKIVKVALAEDVGSGDATTLSTIPKSARARASMVAREPLVVCGLIVAEAAFRQVSPRLRLKKLIAEGARARAGDILMTIEGPAQAVLTCERVALNFVQRLSGIATLTSQFVEAVKNTPARILDTRKTTPGLRSLEKYAVSCGGGQNHRIGLYDMVLVKDNHLAALKDELPNAIEAAVRAARKKFPRLKVEVEADTLEQVKQALFAGADIILLDNMSHEEMRTAVRWISGRAQVEASGGVNLQTIRNIAETGVDFVSIGALTHSARAMDVALDFAL